MGLHAIDETGNIQWHCHTPDCPNHNCGNWDVDCVHHSHLEQPERPQNQTMQAHISHEQVAWHDSQIIALPPCDACGRRLFLNVGWTEAELAEPIIHRDATGAIARVELPPGAAPNFTRVASHIERTLTPVDPATVQQGGQGVRQLLHTPDGLFEESRRLVVDEVQRHPMIARSLQLVEQLKTAGKHPPTP